MNIVVLSPYIPYPPSFGGSVRIYNLLQQLSEHHDLLLLTYDAEDGLGDASGLEGICSEVIKVVPDRPGKRLLQVRSLISRRSFQYHIHHRPEMREALDRALQRHDVDLILVEFSQMACFDFPPDLPVVIDQHNVEFDLIRRMAGRSPVSFRKLYNWIEAVKYKREEVCALRESDLALATSERDANLMRDLVPGLSTAVVTNGVDTEYFRNPGREARPNTLVFVGATHYFPNEDGIHFFMRQIYPLILREIPDLEVYLVGGRPPESIRRYDSENVEVTGFVDDVRPYMHRAAACIVPLRIGGGTRFKVVEAMAAETPVVSTSLGSEGIPLEEGRHALLADTPEDFAEAVLRVLRDGELAESLRREGLEFVRNNFDWSVIGDRLNEELQKFESDA